jgi:hypothetical protein
MNTVVISRKQTSFRLRTDLLDDAYDVPNEDTAEAIREAQSGKYAGKLCMDNLDAFRKSIEEE